MYVYVYHLDDVASKSGILINDTSDHKVIVTFHVNKNNQQNILT